MVWLVLATLAASIGLTFGALAAVERLRGKRSAIIAAGILLLGCLSAGGFAYLAYVDQRHGALPPNHFDNTVLGNIIIVGGLLASVGGVIGVVAVYFALLQNHRS